VLDPAGAGAALTFGNLCHTKRAILKLVCGVEELGAVLHRAQFLWSTLMKIYRSISSLAGAAVLAVAALGASGAAQADEVYWSVGLSSPGVQLGFANAQPVVVMPQPMYRPARPVYMAPPPVVYAQPVPVYMAQPQYVQAGWQRPGYGWGGRHGHRHHGRFDNDRFDGGRSDHGRHGRH
jgi:hypothetical protein